MVVTLAPSACTASTVQDFTAHAVQQHGAGAALAGVASDLRAGESGVAEEVHQQEPGLDVALMGAAVDADRDGTSHGSSLPKDRSPRTIDLKLVRRARGRIAQVTAEPG